MKGNDKRNVENEEVTISTNRVGQVWRLPDGQLVLVLEERDVLVSARRLEGDQANTIVVCQASELRPK